MAGENWCKKKMFHFLSFSVKAERVSPLSLFERLVYSRQIGWQRGKYALVPFIIRGWGLFYILFYFDTPLSLLYILERLYIFFVCFLFLGVIYIYIYIFIYKWYIDWCSYIEIFSYHIWLWYIILFMFYIK